jgi:hypothetical protein
VYCAGYFVLTNDVSLWKRAVFIYSLFVLLLAMLMAGINVVWSAIFMRKGHYGKSELQPSRASRADRREQRSRHEYAAINSDESETFLPVHVGSRNSTDPYSVFVAQRELFESKNSSPSP